MFDLYFAREVPDEGETLLAFVDGSLYDTETLADAPCRPIGSTTRSSTGCRCAPARKARLDTGAGYVALRRAAARRPASTTRSSSPPTSRRRERDEINDAVRTQAIVQFGMIVIASLLGLALAGRVLRPLSTLADTAQTISATDLTRRIPVRGEDEASRIATAFNDMLERIERANATQRRFLDDASHELRSPMTVIRGHVELLELETDPHERDAMVKIITDEIDRMNRIVEDLLLLARSERPGFLSLEPVDIAELTDDVHRRASVLCGRTWRLDQTRRRRHHGRPPTPHPGDGAVRPERVRAHAGRASPRRIGSQVERRMRSTCGSRTTGPVCPPSRRRTCSTGSSRARTGPEGSGLGLSIVAAIAEAHGGRARLAPHDRARRPLRDRAAAHAGGPDLKPREPDASSSP